MLFCTVKFLGKRILWISSFASLSGVPVENVCCWWINSGLTFGSCLRSGIRPDSFVRTSICVGDVSRDGEEYSSVTVLDGFC